MQTGAFQQFLHDRCGHFGMAIDVRLSTGFYGRARPGAAIQGLINKGVWPVTLFASDSPRAISRCRFTPAAERYWIARAYLP